MFQINENVIQETQTQFYKGIKNNLNLTIK